jgi:hypothetical protein
MGRAGTSNRWWDSRCRSRAFGAELRGSVPSDFAELLARVGAPPLPVDTHDGAPAEGCAAPVLRGVMTDGVWR